MPVNLQPSTGTTGNLKKERSREGSRRMPTNSRPPLSHRIRASFEGKKSQDSTSTKHASFSGGSPTDPEVLRQAIDQAISGDAFQAGLASHIAKLLKPDIKTALDTIEPIVNAVLQHEILLKKTNAGMDHVLLSLESMTDQEEAVDSPKARFSTHGALTSHPISDDPRSGELPLPMSHTSTPGTNTPRSFSNQKTRPLPSGSVTHTAGKLSEISDTLDSNNNKLGKLVDGITKINNLLISGERLDSLKESLKKNDTKTSVMQTQLDQLQENVRVIITRIAISAKLEVLNGNLDSGTSSNNVNLGLLKEQITALQSTLNPQKEILLEIKEANNNAMILAGIQKSNESHEAHTAILGELKERNVQAMDVPNQPALTSADAETIQTILTEVQKSNEAHEKHTAALERINNSEINTAILAEVQKSNDSHLAHASALGTLTSLSTKPSEPTASIDLEGLESKIDSLIETSTSVLTEVQKSNESHVFHAAALENIKALQAPPLIPAGENVIEIVEENMGCIIEKLNNHAAVLDEIKAKTKDAAASTTVAVEAFDSQFGSISGLLEAQKALLEEIKSKDILSADFSPIISILEAHAVTLDQIKSKKAGDSTDFCPITSILEAHTATLEEIRAKEAHIVDLSPITSTLESHSAVLHEIKLKDIQSINAPATIDMEALKTHFNSVTGILAAHTTALDDIKSKDGSSESALLADINIKALDKHFGSISSMLEAHTAALNEIKSKAIRLEEPNTAAFDGHFNSLISKLESHTVALDELKSRSNDASPPLMPREDSSKFEFFEPHITAIKSALNAHRIVLDDIKSETLAKNGMDAMVVDNILEPHIMVIKSTLSAHTAILEELKSNASTSEIGNSSLPNILKSLTSHRNLLQEIKNADVSDEILTALHELQESNSTAFETLKESDVSDEILTALHTCNDSQEKLDRSLLELQTVMNNAASSEENGKKTIEETEIQAPIAAVDLSGLETQINTVITTLEGQNVVLREIMDITNSGMEAHSSHTATLDGLRNAANDSNDFHMANAAVLGEIKGLAGMSNESHGSHSATLGVIRDATAALSGAHSAQITTLGELQEAIHASNKSQKTHSNTLGEIKDAAASLNEAHLTHTTTLAELKEAIIASNASHTSHTAVLADLKSQLSLDTAAEPIPAPILDTSGLDAQLTNIITTLRSQTAALGEIKDVHTSHKTTLEEVKDAATAFNESHSAHGALLSEIKDATVQVHGMNEILSTHTDLLEDLKEDSGLRHAEVKSSVEELKKIVEESSSKHEENLLKHGELIKEHEDLVKENHDGLKGTIAGLTLGGIVGAVVMKAVDGEEDKVDKVSDVVEQVEEAKGTTDQDMISEEGSPVLESEVQADEESAPELTEEQLEAPVEGQVVTEAEAQLEPEIIVEEERIINADEDSLNLEKDAEAILTEPEVAVETQKGNLVAYSAPVEQEAESEIIVEKGEPIEEQTPIQSEPPVQEVEVKEPIPTEELELATTNTQDITLALDTPQAEENVHVQKLLPEEMPRSIDSEVLSETSPEMGIRVINEEADVEENDETGDITADTIEEPSSAKETSAAEELEVHEQEPKPENDIVTEFSKDELEPEERNVVEEIPGEKEIIAVEGSKKEGNGESKGDEEQVENLADGDDLPFDEITAVVAEEDKSREEVTLSSEAEEIRPADEAILAEEENSTGNIIPEKPIEDFSIKSEETHPLGTDEKSSEEADLPSLEDNPAEILVPEVATESPYINMDDVDTEIHVVGSGGQEKTPIEMDTKVVEKEDCESSDGDAPSQIAENCIEPLQEESISKPADEAENSVKELKDHDQTFVESEELPRKLENIKEELSSNSTEAIGYLKETSISTATGETKTPIAELNDQDSILVENGGVSVDADPIESVAKDLGISENRTSLVRGEGWDLETNSQNCSNESVPAEITERAVEHLEQTSDPAIKTDMHVPESSDRDQLIVENEEKSAEAAEVSKPDITGLESLEEQLQLPVGEKGDSEISTKDAIQDSVADDEFPFSTPETIEETQNVVEGEELHQLTERQAAEVLKELTFEERFPLARKDENGVGTAPDKIISEPEVKDEKLMNIPESYDETHFATDDKEEPTSTEEKVIEKISEDSVPAREPISQHVINEDSEDVRAREEIAALNAQIAKILAEEAKSKHSEPIVEETNETIDNNAPAETEIFPREEPNELEIGSHSEESTNLPNVQIPVETQEIFEEHLEDESVHRDATELAEEGKKPVASEQHLSEAHPGDNLDELAAASIELKEDGSFEEPETEIVENKIIILTDGVARHGESTPDIDESTSQAQFAEDENLLEEKSLEISTGLEDMIPKSRNLANEPTSEAMNDENSPLEVESLFGEEPQELESESVAAAFPAETETKDPRSVKSGDGGDSSANIKEKESLFVQLEPEIVTGADLRVAQFDSLPAIFAQERESNDSEPERVFENSPVQEASKEEPNSKINPAIERGNEDMEDAIPFVEHLEVIESEPSLEENLRDTPVQEDEESEIVDEYFDNTKEPETEELIPENISEWFDSSKKFKDNPAEDRAQKLEDLAEVKSPEPGHEEISTSNSGIQHNNEPNRDEIVSEISSSDPVQEEWIALEEKKYCVPLSLPVNDNIQTEIHQISEDVLPAESQVAQNSSVPIEHKVDSIADSTSRESFITPQDERIIKEGVSLESKSVLGHQGTTAEENNDHSPHEDTFHDKFVSKFLLGSEPQAQFSIENLSGAKGTPREETIPLEKEVFSRKEKTVIEPTHDQAFEDNRNLSDEVPVLLKDDKRFEDTMSFNSQDDELEGVMETYRKEEEFPSREGSFTPGAFAADYIDAEQLGQVLEPENVETKAGQYRTQQPNFGNPEPISASKQKYSSYEETPLNVRIFSEYQNDNGTLEPEPKPLPSDFDPRDEHLAHGPSFSRSVPQQKYSDFEETPFPTQTSFSRQYNSERSVPELEPQTTYKSPPYQQANSSELYASQETYGDNTKLAKGPSVTPKYGTKHHGDIPPIPSKSMTKNFSTEAFPTYDESRRSPVSHGLNLGLPVRTSEYAETIRESAKSENERPYLTQNEPTRPPGPSRLPISSQRSAETIRKNSELKKQLSFSRYDSPPTSSKSPQGFSAGFPTRIPSSIEKPRGNYEFENQARLSKRDEGNPQESKSGLGTTDPVAMESQLESIESANRSNLGNFRSLMKQFEGGERELSMSSSGMFLGGGLGGEEGEEEEEE
ncbi:c73947f1-ae0a-42aa-9728-3058d29669e8 [Sclerotinia trifoliorum]|uniref:C73947f1-ae0a-42aa-9728-3058d29669e8 n=1 Tax=Sclerotinia trifoliorum TaxID=28548 RepID=A0A8H2VXD7_9HELO|nr:c73947f1-ae0a-42aa-9728-3058d29669e8 [Sclerotinia trifoliorum]